MTAQYTPQGGIPIEMLHNLHAGLENMLSGNNQATVALMFTREEALGETYGKFVAAILNEAQSFIETRWPLSMDKRVKSIAEALSITGPTPEGVFQSETKVLGLTGVAEKLTGGVMQISFEARNLDKLIIFNVVAEMSMNFSGHRVTTGQNFILGIHHHPES